MSGCIFVPHSMRAFGSRTGSIPLAKRCQSIHRVRYGEAFKSAGDSVALIVCLVGSGMFITPSTFLQARCECVLAYLPVALITPPHPRTFANHQYCMQSVLVRPIEPPKAHHSSQHPHISHGFTSSTAAIIFIVETLNPFVPFSYF